MRIFYFSPQNIHDNIRGIHGIARSPASQASPDF